MNAGDDVPAESFSVTVADASGNTGPQLGNTGWTEMTSWESDSYKGLAHDGSFDLATGRFTAEHDGIYYVAAQVRLDVSSVKPRVMTSQCSVNFPQTGLKAAQNSAKHYKKRVMRAVFALMCVG